eukprot:6492740-Amphidinium_carterae.6
MVCDVARDLAGLAHVRTCVDLVVAMHPHHHQNKLHPNTSETIHFEWTCLDMGPQEQIATLQLLWPPYPHKNESPSS